MKKSWLLLLLFLLAFAGICSAQYWGRRYRPGAENMIRTEGGEWVDETKVRTAREIASHSTGTPIWTNKPGFEKDVFTFVRVIRDRDPEASPSAGSWITDFPDSDLNLSFRIQQMTSMKVDPDGRTLRLTDPDLFNYPWIYTVEPGGLLLRDEEVPILRKYLLNGGVLMVDDFWGRWQWESFAAEMKRVFPDRDFVELPMDHPIFHCVFDIQVPKNKLQTPASHWAIIRHSTDFTWETNHRYKDGSPEDCRDVHVRAMLDEKGRIMVIATHDTDNGDAWEREGEDDWFFHEFSEKRGYPLGVNIIFYLMTH
ncbi:MAG TPA: DUF4159 domain-containing protein [Verrucomicrobiae bacterium]|jgi:hypothetical protein|nr:DUF4159 domain-containing protein [Verrucomicrobiae bacterium]